MNFSDALILLKDGNRVSRRVWNRKDTFLHMHKHPRNDFLSYIELRDRRGGINYSAVSADLLAEDWEQVV